MSTIVLAAHDHLHFNCLASIHGPKPLLSAAAGNDSWLACCRFTLQRRMRVLTIPIPLAVTPREVYDGCDSDAVLAVLLHKLIQAAGQVRILLCQMRSVVKLMMISDGS